ncbi:MAG: hypothetical protein ACYDDI_16750 [Candidatus Acidiferrales bacterium]
MISASIENVVPDARRNPQGPRYIKVEFFSSAKEQPDLSQRKKHHIQMALGEKLCRI